MQLRCQNGGCEAMLIGTGCSVVVAACCSIAYLETVDSALTCQTNDGCYIYFASFPCAHENCLYGILTLFDWNAYILDMEAM